MIEIPTSISVIDTGSNLKIIHTSDWHIGRQFHNVALLEDQRFVLEQIIDYVKTEDVDALVIAGDIYDRSVPPATAVELLDEVFNKISNELKVPIIIISGNHDSADRLSFASRQLKKVGLHILGSLSDVCAPIVITGKSGQVVNFYGIPYHDPEQVRSEFDVKVSNHDEAHTFLVEKIKESINVKETNVLISHCFVSGAQESESERPLSIGGSDRVSYGPLEDFDYVALGHLHGPQSAGKEHIRYSGSIMKYSFSEQHHKKGMTLVEFNKEGLASTKPLLLKPIRNMRIIEGEMDHLVSQGKTDPHSDDYLLVRLTDTHAILDAMGKLREVYPNVLHLEKTGIMKLGEKKENNRQMLKRQPIDMFKDFFGQVSGNEMTQEQTVALEEVMKSLSHSESGS